MGMVGDQHSRALVEHAPDAILVLDVATGRFVSANAAAEQLFGLSRRDLHRVGPIELSPPYQPDGRRSRDAAEAYVAKAVDGETATFEWMLHHADGKPIRCEVRMRRLPDDDRVLVRCSVLDIGDRHEIEARLRRSEHAFRLLAETSSDLVGRHSEDGIWQYASRGSRRLGGYEPSELVGRDHHELIHPDDLPAVRRTWQQARDGAVVAVTHRWRRKDGTYVWAETRMRQIRDDRGLAQIQTVSRDVTERVEAEAALHDSEERFRTLAQQAPVGIFETDAEGVVTYANERLGRIVGRPAAELLGDRWPRHVRRDDHDRVAAEWRDALEAGREWSSEYRVAARDGRTRWVLASARPVFDAAGTLTGFVGTCTDVTEHKEAEEALRAVRGLAAVVWEADPQTLTLSFVGTHASQMLGYTPDRWTDLVHPEDRDQAADVLTRALRDWQDHDLTYRALTADGRTLWLHDVVHVDRDHDGPRRIHGVMVDVTQQKQAEEAVTASEARFRLVADAAPVMIWMTDAAMQCTFVNQPWLDFTGRTLREELGEGWLHGVHPADLDRRFGESRAAFRARAPFEMEYRLRRADSAYRWILGRGQPIVGSDGFRGYIGGCIDITERRRVEQASTILAEAGRLLGESLDLDESLEALCRVGVPHLGDVCVIALQRSDGTLERVAIGHERPDLEHLVKELPPLRADSPIARAARECRPIIDTDIDPRAPGVAAARTLFDLTSAIAVPLIARGRVLGSLGFGSADRLRRYDHEDLALAQELGNRAALAMDNERLHGRTTQLHAVTAALASAVTVADVSAALLDGARSALGADGGALYRLGPDRALRLVGTGAGWPADAAAWDGLSVSGDTPMAAATRTGEPVWLETRAAWEHDYPTFADWYRRHGFETAALLPLIVEGRTVGVTCLLFHGQRTFGHGDRAFAQTFVAQCAQAFERARLYEEQHQIAHTLQQGLLPAQLPEIPELELAACYRPLGADVEVGGDFYDVFETPQGWALVIGDVCGKGAEAAQLTALCRYALRTAALRERDGRPGRILGLLNDVIVHHQPDSTRFCSVAYLRLRRRSSGAVEICVASGGHPPMLVQRSAGPDVDLVNPSGGLVGLIPDAEFADRELILEPGDTLLLYTDGVTEARRRGELFGDRRLRELVAEHARQGACALVSRIEQSVIDFQDGPLRDDLAILALRVGVPASRPLELSLPAEPASLAPLRDELRGWLETRGLSHQETEQLLVACNEAATNAIIHAYGAEGPGALVAVRATITDDELTVGVRDRGGWTDPDPLHDGKGIEIMRAMVDSVEIRTDDEGTEVQLRRRVGVRR